MEKRPIEKKKTLFLDSSKKLMTYNIDNNHDHNHHQTLNKNPSIKNFKRQSSMASGKNIISMNLINKGEDRKKSTLISKKNLVKVPEVSYTTMDIVSLLINPTSNRTKDEIKMITSYLLGLPQFVNLILNKIKIESREDTLNQIGSSLRHKFYQKNSIIFKAGDIGEHYYIILSGKVDVLIPKQETMLMTKQEYLQYLCKLKKIGENDILSRCLKTNSEIFTYTDRENAGLSSLLGDTNNTNFSLLNIINEMEEESQPNFKKIKKIDDSKELEELKASKLAKMIEEAKETIENENYFSENADSPKRKSTLFGYPKSDNFFNIMSGNLSLTKLPSKETIGLSSLKRKRKSFLQPDTSLAAKIFNHKNSSIESSPNKEGGLNYDSPYLARKFTSPEKSKRNSIVEIKEADEEEIVTKITPKANNILEIGLTALMIKDEDKIKQEVAQSPKKRN